MHIRPVFDRVVVMDPVALTGEAFCALADGAGIAATPGEYVRDRGALQDALVRYDGQRVLVITELTSHRDSLVSGLAMLSGLRTGGYLRVMVCTGLDDPLMLKMVIDREPAVICLRREPLEELCRLMWKAGEDSRRVRCSPGVRGLMQEWHTIRATPRELEWLVTQVDGMNLNESARAMAVCDKTAYTWRYRLIRRMGGKREFMRYLVRIQRYVVSLTMVSV
ncbi:hypothetical protein [Citrobacter portucalensis]|uniref:hypothetical protein n=1 Tax=Citrobacter portucalensis TaxID=1639133 RepID=UPI001F2B3C6E|nr:hypothetical protein [Citrobacter portucalensis]